MENWISICEIDWTNGTRYMDGIVGKIWEIKDGNLFMVDHGIKLAISPMKRLSETRFKRIESEAKDEHTVNR